MDQPEGTGNRALRLKLRLRHPVLRHQHQGQLFHVHDRRNEVRAPDPRVDARVHRKKRAETVPDHADAFVPFREVENRFFDLRARVPRGDPVIVEPDHVGVRKQRPVMRRLLRAAAQSVQKQDCFPLPSHVSISSRISISSCHPLVRERKPRGFLPYSQNPKRS